jgi:hypothetical protein
LRRSDISACDTASYLERLLRRRQELELVVLGLNHKAARIEGSSFSPAQRRHLRATRRAEVQAGQALERLDWVIADTPAETIEDVVLKHAMLTALLGYAGAVTTGWREPFTVEEQLLRSIIRDLERLKKTRGEQPPF